MSSLRALKPLFSAAVRQRGEAYAESGRVELVDSQDDEVEFEVLGSHGASYEVRLFDLGSDYFDLDCSCPHFDDGNYCKHLWAALRMAERLGLLHSGEQESSNGAPRSRATTKRKSGAAPQPADWRRQLDRLAPQLAQGNSPPDVLGAGRQVYYLLEVMQQGPTPEIVLQQRQRLKNGEWGKTKPLQVTHDLVDGLSQEDDRRALGMLMGNRARSADHDDYYDDYYRRSYNSSTATRIKLSPALYAAVLPALAATGRFVWLLSSDQHWDDARAISWDEGPPWRFRVRAESPGHGKQWRLSGELYRGRQRRPLSDAIRCYSSGLLLIDDRLSRFESPADFRWVQLLSANSELLVPESDREALVQELWRAGQSPKVVGDDSLNLPCVTVRPQGRLVVHPARERRYGQDRFLYASVSYCYEGKELTPGSSAGAWLAPEGDRMFARDAQAESEMFDRLLHLGLEPKKVNYYGDTPPGHLQLAPGRLNDVVEALVGEGWDVKAEGARLRRGSSVSLSVRSGVDWFDLEGEVDFDGQSASLPELLKAIHAGERYIKLGDGSRGILPQEWLDRYAAIGDLASTHEKGALRFQTGQALLLDSLLSNRESDQRVKVDHQFAAWRKRLRSFTGIKPVATPRAFQGELRDYQREGLGWLRFLEKLGFGGCLADDMGLGKTIQVLALLAERRRRQPRNADPRPSLVVAPKSLVHNWRLETERFAPKLRVADYVGIDRKDRVGDFAEHDLVLTTYGTLRQDAKRIAETPWDYAILDEAQAIKNPASQTAKASRVLQARCRLALSGTPVENHLGELWSIFEFLNPGLLGASSTLSRLVSGSSDNGRDDQLQAIRKGIAPFLLRRTKEQVLPQLPKKSEQSQFCDLPPAQRKQYNELRDHYRASLESRIAKKGLAKSKVHVLEALLRLRQAACHPGLIDDRQKSKPSAKLDLLLEQLREVIDEGHKALVFSQFTSMLAIVRDRLDKAGVVYEYLDGKTRDRQARVERFQTDADCQAFLISLKAGGCGLNLTAADYVFLLDPWWNPAVEAQAIDRAHRIGQERPVFAYRLIARDTVEEKIIELQKSKRELADAIVSADSSLLRRLTADDLQLLLE